FSAQYNRHFSGITRRAQVALGRYAWPGTVRELGSVLGNACMLAENDVIDVCDLPSRILKSEATLSPVDVNLSLEEIQRRHILRVLDAVGDDKRNAAEVLGIGISTLYAFLAKNKRGENGGGRKKVVTLTSEPYLVEAPPARNEMRLRARKG
ncbi:MAG TPA: helix-turn-helix domain-containing protein, partial [Terriglobales bacterium]|nr:helix-turn-helix domain-containing protein [Terriglobales bacterium]